MAIVYCDDGGSNTSPYDTWAKAATTFLVAVDFASAGDDIYIGADHSEAPGTNTVYTFPGTAAAPNRVISVTVGTTTYNKADNIQIDLSTGGGGLWDCTIVGTVKFYGVSIKIGDDLKILTTAGSVLFDDSVLELSRTTGAQLQVNVAAREMYFRLKNTDLNFSGGSASSGIVLNNCPVFEWHGGTLSWSGTQPTALFDGMIDLVVISVAGVDLSSVSTALVDVSDQAQILAEFHHCLLHASVALTTGTIAIAGTKVLMSGCDDTTGNDLYRSEYVDYYGSKVHDDAIFVTTGGASDGTTPISWKIVTTANAAEFSEPLISPLIVVWVDSTGSKTFTVQCLWDSVTDIQNDEIWLEVEYLEASADTDSAFANDGLADILATPADQTTNSTAWTESLTNDNEFALAVTVTVNRVGPAICRVHMGKPSTTVYVDPLVTVT